MKKFYFIGVALVLASAGALIAYGAYLNESNESQTMQRIKFQTIPLQNAKAMFRDFQPIFVLEAISLQADAMPNSVTTPDDSNWLNFSLLMEDAVVSRLSIGERFDLCLRNNSPSISVYVEKIMPDLNQAAAMRKVFFKVDNHLGTLEQQVYSDVDLITTTAYKALTVPLLTVVDNRQYVFVQTPEKTIERRKVSIGADDGQYMEILSGLQEGELVIISTTSSLEEDITVPMTLSEVGN